MEGLFKMALTKAQAAAEVMIHLCYHAAHGYSQPARKGDGTVESVELSDGTKVNVHGGDYDCSEAVRQCWAAVGVLPESSYMWTGNEKELLTAHGFQELDFVKANLKVGDVLWKSGHTEIVVSDGLQGGFRGDENGGLGQGAKQGDQTGNEASVKPIADYWDKVFRYTKDEQPAAWVKSSNGKWWYRNSDNSYPKSQWQRIAGKWYHFDSKGWMQTGWIKESGSWYYLQSNGAMLAKTCAQINGEWYVFGRDGAMKSGAVGLNSNGSIHF